MAQDLELIHNQLEIGAILHNLNVYTRICINTFLNDFLISGLLWWHC